MGIGGSEEMPPPLTANYRQEMGSEGSGETGPFPPPLRLAFSPFFSFPHSPQAFSRYQFEKGPRDKAGSLTALGILLNSSKTYLTELL